jgi:hypothetical protein
MIDKNFTTISIPQDNLYMIMKWIRAHISNRYLTKDDADNYLNCNQSDLIRIGQASFFIIDSLNAYLAYPSENGKELNKEIISIKDLAEKDEKLCPNFYIKLVVENLIDTNLNNLKDTIDISTSGC